jgi:hypothetical protein
MYILLILGQPGDGLSGRNILLNKYWNKQLLCLTGFTVILIIHNTMVMKRLRMIGASLATKSII